MTAACRYCGGTVEPESFEYGSVSLWDTHAKCEREFIRRDEAGKCVRCGRRKSKSHLYGTQCDNCYFADRWYAGYYRRRKKRNGGA